MSLNNLGHHLLVGAPLEGPSGIGINGNDLDNTSIGNGALIYFVMKRSKFVGANPHFVKTPNRDPEPVRDRVALSIDAKTMLIPTVPPEKIKCYGSRGEYDDQYQQHLRRCL